MRAKIAFGLMACAGVGLLFAILLPIHRQEQARWGKIQAKAAAAGVVLEDMGFWDEDCSDFYRRQVERLVEQAESRARCERLEFGRTAAWGSP